MKIDPAQRPAAPPPASAKPMKASFADLVAAPLGGVAAAQDHAAAGFQALGMFGRTAALESPPPARDAPPVREPEVRTALPDAEALPVAAVGTGPAGRHGEKAARAPAGAVSVRASSPAASPPVGIAGTGEPAAESGRFFVADGEGPVEGFRAVGGDPRPRAAAGADEQAHVRLAPAGKGDATAVVVRAAGLSETDVQAFRARARTLLREHGLSLDKLNLNGEDRNPPDPLRRKPQPWP